MSGESLKVHAVLGFDAFELNVDEELELEGVTAVFGPSGSGKSTLLRTIAGFTKPREGLIRCGSDLWFDSRARVDVAPHQRAVGFMFQHTCLFTHLDVAGNLDFAGKRRRRQRPRITQADVVAALDLKPLLDRRVASLSGGERQRVALGRTLLSDPRLLMLDEPLAALDRERKGEIIPYLESLPRRFDIPTLYVSHDIDEIIGLADRTLVLAEGRVQLHGSIADAVDWLDLQVTASRYDAGALVEGRISSHDTRLKVSYVDVGGDTLTMPLVARLAPGQPIRLRIRTRDVALATREPQGLSIRNVIPGRLLAIRGEADSGFVEATVEARGARIRARITQAAAEDLQLEEGMPVFALVKSVSFERGG